jgi:hypothetical protein
MLAAFVLPIICIASGILLLIGLFTPVTGAVATAVKGGGSPFRNSPLIPEIHGFSSPRPPWRQRWQ